jgi:hypothetical protein
MQYCIFSFQKSSYQSGVGSTKKKGEKGKWEINKW